MPNGSRINVVVDTNIYFMALYNPFGKAAKLLRAAIEERVGLFSPDIVKEELTRVLKRKLEFSSQEMEDTIIHLPVAWISSDMYRDFMQATIIIKHKPDRPLLATALVLGCGIITANRRHFLPARRLAKIWNIDELLKNIEQRKSVS
ncbi:type II toxin-antitoxin system VapC family toxin [Candidatus Woesearchaeota archaeon]|nr:type II toxin-antitoxin system VapC family toxin [Candidatus Woesearchaeota archaeon]